MRKPAIVLASGCYATTDAKAAHGLVRGSERYSVQSVVDPDNAGRDAGSVLDGHARGIPIVNNLDEALACASSPAEVCFVGVAPHGGRLTASLRALLLQAAQRGLSLVSGLHDLVGDDAEINAAARASGVQIIDIRKPVPRNELHSWEGLVSGLSALRLAVLGTDCAVGKRTTARMLVSRLNDAGVRTEMIYTGQTGWMQGARFGFVLDATVNDYVSGELEQALLRCAHEADPQVMVIEGQSSLRNPAGPCGAELLLSGQVAGVILQHAADRTYFEGYEDLGLRIPSLLSEIELIAMCGAATVAVTLNGGALDERALTRCQREYANELQIPVICPLLDGIDPLVDAVRRLLPGRGG